MHWRSMSTPLNDYKLQYMPIGSWLLVEKDMLPNKIGALFIPDTVQRDKTKFTSTGRIISKSMFHHLENEWESYTHSILMPGDRIGFGATIPLLSPAPPDYVFAEEERKFVTLHVTDVIGVFFTTEEELEEFSSRFNT